MKINFKLHYQKKYFKQKGGEKIGFTYWNILFKKMKKDLYSKNYSYRTVEDATCFWKNFSKFLKQKKIVYVKNLKSKDITEYITFLSKYKTNTIYHYLSYLKKFLKYLYLHKLHTNDLSYSIHKIRISSNKNIPHTIWSKEEVNKILKAIDVSTPVGKRDYAI